MNNSEHGYQPPEESRDSLKKLTKAEVLAIMSKDKKLDNADINGLKFNGENLSGGSFRGCNASDIDLSPKIENIEGKEIEVPTDISNTDWTNTALASAKGDSTSFKGVKAENAKFGFEITLTEREKILKQIQQEKRAPNEFECGAYYNFDGRKGNFKGTKWTNVDFGGEFEGHEAFLSEADFTNATFDKCNLRGIDLSKANLDGVKFIVNDESLLDGMVIRSDQAEIMAKGIVYEDKELQPRFEFAVDCDGPKIILWECFGIQVID